MKNLLMLSTLVLLLSGCSSEAPVEDENDLMEMMDEENPSVPDDENAEPSEEPYSSGPTEIPSDLVPNDEQ
ncbi:hypothetical protein IPG41_06330 [Candidatus Peregrinibacteria bacterium]|nr:MAG: hypothetical protein IPG41_06330 [Candidatus Peregrinibacteria bacterium]